MTNHASSTYAAFVADIKKTYSHEYLPAQRALGVNVRHYREWDVTDLLALYDSFFGRQVFIHLSRLAGEAEREGMMRDGVSHDTLGAAQRDLNAIAPTGMDWRGYVGMMHAAVSGIKEKSRRITSDLATLLANEQTDTAEPYAATPAFDSQAALARLEAHTVATVMTPQKSAMSNVVTGLRSVFHRAAS